MATPWYGFDFDGTLVEYYGWKGANHIGKPIPSMMARVKKYLMEGKKVKIFTARVSDNGDEGLGRATQVEVNRQLITAWCLEHFGRSLPVTCIKDNACVELWDDRAVQVIPNTGEVIQESLEMARRNLKAWEAYV